MIFYQGQRVAERGGRIVHCTERSSLDPESLLKPLKASMGQVSMGYPRERKRGCAASMYGDGTKALWGKLYILVQAALEGLSPHM